MLGTRIILGTIFVAALVGLCWLDYQAARPGIFLLPLAAVLSLAGTGELLATWRRHENRTQPLPWVVYVGTLITIVAASSAAWLPTASNQNWLAFALVASLLLAMVGEMYRYDGSGTATSSLALSTLAVLYVGGLMGFLVQLRLLGGGPWGTDGRWGVAALVSVVAIVKMSDIGQYTIGRLVGKHKLAVFISPGKTWEGAAGGIAFAIATALLIRQQDMLGSASVLTACVYALSLAIAGIVGDLAESMLKRDAGVKDSSTWLPGFGGVLDLLDSLLGAAPVAFLFWALRLVGPQPELSHLTRGWPPGSLIGIIVPEVAIRLPVSLCGLACQLC